MTSIPITILTGGTAQAVGNLVDPTTEAGKVICSSLQRKYEYVKNLDRNFENLDKEARYLTSRKKDVNDLIGTNQIIAEKSHECTTWLEDVDRITTDLDNMRIKYEQIKGTSKWYHIKERLKLSKQAVKLTASVAELNRRINPDHMILTERHHRLRKIPENISEIPSLGNNVERLIELLNDDDIKKIGIWGMSGVGKTTILENLSEDVAKLQMFDIVLWVTVSKEDGVHGIQQAILKQLTTKVDVINERCQAAVFISEMLDTLKYLLLLDEVSSKIELREVGIHNHHMYGKVVLATRERTLCYAMEMDDDIKIDGMSRDDARKLFCDVVGKVAYHPNIVPVVDRIVSHCGEQPQIIRAVGSYLKGKLDEDLWRNTLSGLQSPNLSQLNHLEDVFTAFKLIFEELHSSLKECLLYGASFPENHDIYRDYLVDCWKTEELIGIGHTLRKAREEGHANLADLIDKCLFDPCRQSKKHVKMPCLFRTAALRMLQTMKFGLLIMNEEDVDGHTSMVAWRNARVISLMSSSLTELPPKPECPEISTLFLQKNNNISAIPASFFEGMSTLKTLDLYATCIKELPPSVSKLTNLRGLYLNKCQHLMSLPDEVQDLQNLEILDVCRSGIVGFPAVIAQLATLQCLRVSCTGVLGNVKVLERLERLEELVIIADPRDPHWIKIAPEIVGQLAKLRKLSALTFYFPSLESLELFTESVSWKNTTSQTRSNFRSFNFYVGSHPNNKSSHMDVSKCSARRYIQYSGGINIPTVIKEVLKSACAFELINHRHITNFSDLSIDGMKSLEICLIEGCSTMKAIVDDNVTSSAFPWLQELHLLKLHELTHISKGPVFPESFASLTKLVLNECPKMSEAMSWEMVKELNELQELRVEKCSQMTKVFEMSGQSIGTIVCPKLEILELNSLGELLSIHNGSLFNWNGLRKIIITRCDKLDNVCLTEGNAKRLRDITCNSLWWTTLDLSAEIRAHLLPFCYFV